MPRVSSGISTPLKSTVASIRSVDRAKDAVTSISEPSVSGVASRSRDSSRPSGVLANRMSALAASHVRSHTRSSHEIWDSTMRSTCSSPRGFFGSGGSNSLLRRSVTFGSVVPPGGDSVASRASKPTATRPSSVRTSWTHSRSSSIRVGETRPRSSCDTASPSDASSSSTMERPSGSITRIGPARRSSGRRHPPQVITGLRI